MSWIDSHWALILALGIMVFFTIAVTRSYYRQYAIRQEIAKLQEETARLEVKKLATLQALNYVKSPAFVEEKARTEFNFVRPGEQAAIITGRPKAIKGALDTIEPQKEDMISNPRKWWNYFFEDEN